MMNDSSESTITNLVPIGGMARLSGSPSVPMTVAGWTVNPEGKLLVKCFWHDKNGVPHGRALPIEILNMKAAGL